MGDLISAICLGSLLLLSRDIIVLGVLIGRFIRYRWGLLKLERVTEDSKSWFATRSVTDKFMTQTIATFAAAYLRPWWENKQTNPLDPLTRKWIKKLYLVSSGFLFNFRDRIFVESLIKCGPGGLVLVFGSTSRETESFLDLLFKKFENLPRKELVAALNTDINPCFEMFLVFLPSPKCREHLVLVEKL